MTGSDGTSSVAGADVRVRGGATAEELAALFAALRIREARPRRADRFEQWRRQRQAVLRENR